MMILYVICPFDDQKPYFQDWWTMIRRLDLYALLSLNGSNLIFIFSAISNSCSKAPGSQRSPRLSGQIVCLCPVWFFSCQPNEGNSKIWQISNEIFCTISWDSSQIYGCTLKDTMMQKCWEEIKLYFPLSDFSGVQFPFIHNVFPHTISSSRRSL